MQWTRVFPLRILHLLIQLQTTLSSRNHTHPILHFHSISLFIHLHTRLFIQHKQNTHHYHLLLQLQYTQNTPKTPIKLSYTSIFISIITPWAFTICFQFLQQSIILIKNTFSYLLSDILSFDCSSYFHLIFLPSILNLNQHTINHIPTVFKQNIKRPFTKTATTIYNYLRPYCMQTIFIATFHLFQYSLFTLWAYSHHDLQFRNFCFNLRTALTIFILFYYIPIQFRTDTHYFIRTSYTILVSYLHTYISSITQPSSPPNNTMAPTTRTRRTISLPEAAESPETTTQLLTQEDIIQTIHTQLNHNTDIIALRHDVNVLHIQLEDIRNALISLTMSQQQQSSTPSPSNPQTTPPPPSTSSQHSPQPPPSHISPTLPNPSPHATHNPPTMHIPLQVSPSHTTHFSNLATNL